MKKFLVVLIIILVHVSLVFSQSPYREKTTQTTRDFITTPVTSVPFSGLLDPSRLSMGHQFGMSYSSIGGSGFTRGYYMNTLAYQFNAPVVLKIRTGVTNNPFAQSAGSHGPGATPFGGMFDQAEFFGGAEIDWRPRDNVFLRLSVDRLPTGIGYTNPAYNRWSMFGPGYDFGPRYTSPIKDTK